MRKRFATQDGFTLVEIIAVLILLGILAAVAVPKYIDLTSDAEVKAVQAAVAELNGRENMVWARVKLTDTGWTADTDVTGHADYDTGLGTDFTWSAADAPDAGGGTLVFKGNDYVLTRAASTDTSPGMWSN